MTPTWKGFVSAALVLAAAACLLAAYLFARIDSEGRERRDQACRGAEAAHKQEVRDLSRTYKLLADPPPELKALLSNPLVLQGIKDDIRAARLDGDQFGVFVGPYCDEPGIGLPEPDPVVPPRPPDL